MMPKTEILPIAKQMPTKANQILNTQNALAKGKTKHETATNAKTKANALLVPILLIAPTEIKEKSAIGRSLKASIVPRLR